MVLQIYLEVGALFMPNLFFKIIISRIVLKAPPFRHLSCPVRPISLSCNYDMNKMNIEKIVNVKTKNMNVNNHSYIHI